MTQQGYRHDIFIIDRSGSMDEILDGMQSGFDDFVREQSKLPGKATASLWQFDDVIERVHAFQPYNKIASYRLEPRGVTAMFDAVGTAVTREGEALAAMPEGERPEVVAVLIVSDGKNNASREYTSSQVAEMLKHQQEVYGWVVIYMGTNQDVFKESAEIGIDAGTSLAYAKTNFSTRQAWGATASSYANATASASAGLGFQFTYSEEDRAKAAAASEDEK